ncbi:Gfo/Idh/MocA family oxidoreductase [Sphaerisporangium sp. B11E5]|uniref:Gfo/Idh/MocA family protein n=1 Tax=Sphaerisporangium sp. B11E5 TaxID=3153563 RepID=UPI00325D015E
MTRPVLPGGLPAVPPAAAPAVTRVGLLGATAIAARAVLAPAAALPGVTVTAVAAGDHDRALKLGAEHGIGRVHRTYADLLADPEVDAVYVSTHPAGHFPLALAALRAGKHALVEKPLCLGACEAETLRLARRDAGVCLAEAVMSAHHPWAGDVDALAAAHDLGTPREARTELVFDRRDDPGYRAFPELGGGAFLDTAPYWLRTLQAWRGLDVTRAEGRSAFDGPNGTDAAFEAELAYPDGVVATLTCGLHGRYRADHTVTFERGTLRVRDFLRPARGPFQLNVHVTPDGGPRRTVGYAPAAYYERQLAAFLGMTADPGRGAGELDGAVRRTALIERVRLSALRAHGDGGR